MNSLRLRLAETHSTRLELTRHFFLRFFDSDFVSMPGQWRVIAGGVVAILLSSAILFIPSYYRKYRMLHELDTRVPFQMASMADTLFIVTLVMTVLGLLTTLQWNALFPSLRDYYALAALPIRPRTLFVAKFTALCAFAACVTIAIATPISILLPILQEGKHSAHGLLHIPVNWIATAVAGGFVFFALVAVQGVLLNVMPVRFAQRVSLSLQAAMLSCLLCVVPVVLATPRLHTRMMERPGWGAFAPPLWFVGLREVLAGNREPYAVRLALIALSALGLAIGLALATYLWSFRRHRIRLLHSSAVFDEGGWGNWLAPLGARLIPDTRQFAIFSFIGKTLARSGQHRLILASFAAVALAIVFDGFVTLALGDLTPRAQTLALRHAVVSAPLAMFLFLLAGFRYLFRLPVELRANWVFRVNEPDSRTLYLTPVQRFVLTCGVLPVALATLPVEMVFLGTRQGIGAFVLTTLVGLVLCEAILLPFERVPFTSSYIPGKRPLIETLILYGVSVALFVSVLGGVIVLAIASIWYWSMFAAGLAAVLWKLRSARLESWRTGRLEYEESLEPAVLTLSIDRD